MEENPDKILSGIVENCKILNSKVDNMAAVLIFLKKGELKAWLFIFFITYYFIHIYHIFLLFTAYFS